MEPGGAVTTLTVGGSNRRNTLNKVMRKGMPLAQVTVPSWSPRADVSRGAAFIVHFSDPRAVVDVRCQTSGSLGRDFHEACRFACRLASGVLQRRYFNLRPPVTGETRSLHAVRSEVPCVARCRSGHPPPRTPGRIHHRDFAFGRGAAGSARRSGH